MGQGKGNMCMAETMLYSATMQLNNGATSGSRLKGLKPDTLWEEHVGKIGRFWGGSVVFLSPVGLLNDTPEEVEFLTVKRFLTLEGLM